MGYRSCKNHVNKAPVRTVAGRGNDPNYTSFFEDLPKAGCLPVPIAQRPGQGLGFRVWGLGSRMIRIRIRIRIIIRKSNSSSTNRIQIGLIQTITDVKKPCFGKEVEGVL